MQRQNKKVDILVCRWNRFHQYPAPEMKFHEETCGDAGAIVDHLILLSDPEAFKYKAIENKVVKVKKTEDSDSDTDEEEMVTAKNMIQHYEDQSEDWTEEVERNRSLKIGGYNPQDKLRREAGNIIQ